MKRSCLVLIFLSCTPYFFAKENSFFSNLRRECVQQVTEQNPALSQTISKAFDAYYRLPKQTKTIALLEHVSIHNLFSLPVCRSSNFEMNQGVQRAQRLMLVFLYERIFRECIAYTEQLVQQLSHSLNYWRIEKFYGSLPISHKHPVYWFHSPAYKKQIQVHAQALEQIERDINSLLGISLHGRYVLSKVQHDQDLPCRLQQSIHPLYEYFNMPISDGTHIDCLFQDALWLYEKTQNQLQHCKEALVEHKKPHHIIDHGFLYSCIACGVIAAYVTYKVHEQDIPEYQHKAKTAWDNFVLEYIKIPLRSLKEILWDNKIQEMPKLPPPTELKPAKLKAPQEFKPSKLKPPQEMTISQETYAFEWMNNIRKELNDVKRFVNEVALNSAEFVNESIVSSADFINENAVSGADFVNESMVNSADFVNENMVNGAKCYNDNTEVINKTILRNQQVNLHLAAIGPVLIVSYFLYRGGMSMYKQQVTHESWYKPMRLMVREIDKILNKITAQEQRSYVDDGALYILVLRLKTFIYCLPNEEIYLIAQDLKELNSYDLSYVQKRGVLKRMYRTYPFLKKSVYS